MKFDRKDPPRTYEAGFGEIVHIKDCGAVTLEPEEQVTFLTESGGEYDLTRKSWGFYATPSLNGRLEQFGLRGVMVKSRINRFFIVLVERGKEELFQDYLRIEGLNIVTWLDDSATLARLDRLLTEHPQTDPERADPERTVP